MGGDTWSTSNVFIEVDRSCWNVDRMVFLKQYIFKNLKMWWLKAFRDGQNVKRTLVWPYCLLRSVAGGKFGSDWWDGVFGDLAVVLSTVGVALSTNATYSAAWKMWVSWRQDGVKRSMYLVGCEFGGVVGYGRYLKVIDIYVLFKRE